MTSAAVIAAVQFATGITFVVVPVIAHRYGSGAQQAAEDAVAAQGFPRDLLAKHRVRFAESAREATFPLGIAAVLITMASLNLAGSPIGTVSTWVLQPLLLIAGGVTTAGQVFPARFTDAALRRAGPAARGLNTRAVIAAAGAAFPAPLRPLIVIRFALVTVGSAAVLTLLAT